MGRPGCRVSPVDAASLRGQALKTPMATKFHKIRTPPEFRSGMGAKDFVLNQWMPLLSASEADIRHTVDEIFTDLQYIDSGDHGLAAAFLDGIAEPLERLQRELGMQLVVCTTRGKLTLPVTDFAPTSKDIPWERAHYIVAPDPAFFGMVAGPIHKLGTSCTAAFKLAVQDQGDAEVRVWASVHHLSKDFERAVPWCSNCRSESPELFLA